MKSWPVQDAKARFSEFVETCLNEGPQMVTKRGLDTAVLIPARDWARMQQSARSTLKDLLLMPESRSDFTIPTRGRLRRQPPKTHS